MKKFILSIVTFVLLFAFPASVNGATFNVTHTSALSWNASYHVTTSGNTIKKVSHIKTHALIGRIKHQSLIRDSSSKVTLKMTRSVGVITYYSYLSAKIRNHKLYVTAS
ncbi:hypothetical protein [Lactobacillus koreensis] [Lactiplantibacillus mudanjiangensis]|uniref:DUF5626 family protein n=1 Tax=Lactiplantibacillus mudanjiangensis TaxID=1296538 RepID=UPI001015A2E0|nr:DUF5626 family protein [Lactiplantibacillus mudanjiangensis]VDG31690.1 hypothetical protein [Lactobacillus koreensis] [Lactiplantibacillus mudanjiangensis]